MDQNENIDITSQALFSDVCGIIDDSRTRVAVYVNSQVCLTKWYVGKRIKEDVLYNRRAEYGKQVVKALAAKLTERYGSGWSERNLFHCIKCFELFSEEEIVYAVRTQFSWTHIRTLMTVNDPLARQFYMRCAGWSTGTPVHWMIRLTASFLSAQLSAAGLRR